MGPEGYKMIHDALLEAGIKQAHIDPVINEQGQETTFITIRPIHSESPAEILDALIGKNALFFDEPGLDGRHYKRKDIPWLSAIAIQESSITFRDRNTLNFDWSASF